MCRQVWGLSELKQYMEGSASAVMSDLSVSNFYCDKVTADPARARGPHLYLKEMLRFSYRLVNIKLLFPSYPSSQSP